MQDSPLLVVQDLDVRFGGIVALDRVSFAVPRGVVCGLIGPNGAGKTTLFDCISRLRDPDSGSVRFDGVELASLPRHDVARRGIARTFQNLALFDSLSVLENVLVGMHARTRAGFLAHALRLPGVADEERGARRRAIECLERLGLAAMRDTPVAELPFAAARRVEFARALAGEPELLLLDEPASGLDQEEIDALVATIRSLRRSGSTILLIEHRMDLVLDLSDKVVALHFGRKIADGDPRQVRAHPAVVQAYVGTGAP